jgi:hypothetical protein
MMKNSKLNSILIILSCIIGLSAAKGTAQDLSYFEIMDNASVGLTVTPFSKAGLCLVDIDNNGWADVYCPKYNGPGYSHIYMNYDGMFTDITDQSPLAEIEDVTGIRTFTPVWVDFDNDGDKDLSFGTNKNLHLLRNDDNVFTDVSEETGFVGHQPPGFITSWFYCVGGWADYDLDGDLDCVVFQENNENLYLFRNDGGHFTNAATEAGLDSTKLSDVTFVNWISWTDFDFDGDQDLIGKHDIFENRDGKFYEIADSLGFVLNTNVTNREFFDYDNDGDLDYFKSTNNTEEAGFDELWENRNGHFIDVSADVGLLVVRYRHRGLTIGDFDNDGDQDIFLENSNSDDSYDVLLVNEEIAPGERVFDDVAEFVGLTKTGDRKGCGFFDYDKDGFLDIYMPSAEHNHILYHNAAINETNWIGFILEGTISNHDAIGSIVRLYHAGKQQLRFTKCGNGWVRQDNPWVHFGIGFETSVDSVVISWPLGYRQVLTDVAINQYHDIKEPDYTTVKSRKTTTKPTAFRLDQNYPNPFNPNTSIQYFLKEASYVNLAIYNTTGQKVTTLVQKKQSAGGHQVEWNALNEFGQAISSGVYFYRFEIGNQLMLTKKMVLLE